MPVSGLSAGTGQKLTHATIVLAGASSIIASLLSIVSIWRQTKNYRKPLLQRHVVRILLMVPIYSFSSWLSLVSLRAAIYKALIKRQAFTIYTFFQLLINFIGGERALIIMMHGREPVHHLWPLNNVLPKVDISDPHTFLTIKRGILQYAWLKPVLGLASVIMKATGTYKEGYLGLDSGYLWSGIAYNLSVTISLYSLGMFWACMSKDLQPFRPVPKFLCIKLIIFASYWQGFFLSTIVWLGIIPDNVNGYTPDNIAAAIQDAMICMEMPIFAVGHWYAFSWRDYADASVSAARMPVKHAIRDAFGIRDLIEDTKETFSGKKYEYRFFDSGDNILAHEGSSSRVARMMEGMRYERGGKGKYWIPKPGDINSRTPLLSNENIANHSQNRSLSRTSSTDDQHSRYGTLLDEEFFDAEEEILYDKARALEYGDWNYPVIVAQKGTSERWLQISSRTPSIPKNRSFYQSSKGNHSEVRETRKCTGQGIDNVKYKQKGKNIGSNYTDTSNGNEFSGEETRTQAKKNIKRNHSSGSSSIGSDRTQVVDLIVQDSKAEEIERNRAIKEGGAGWNEDKVKRYLRTYGERTGENIREGYEPTQDCPAEPGYDDEERFLTVTKHKKSSLESIDESRKGEGVAPTFDLKPKYGLSGEALENIWSFEPPSEIPRENS
ncbi:Transmembrane protein 184 [Podosphaera aphanis]|nr:Transmembrane protein 184 [Podosphaera aphanis]